MLPFCCNWLNERNKCDYFYACIFANIFFEFLNYPSTAKGGNPKQKTEIHYFSCRGYTCF